MSARAPRTSAAVLLTAALVAPRAPAADLDPYVPRDAIAVASFDVRQLQAAPVVRDRLLPALKAHSHENAELERLLTAGGVRPDAVTRVVVAASGLRAEKVLVIVHGRFDPDAERAAAEEAARKDPAACRVQTEDGLAVCERRVGRTPEFSVVAGPETVLVSPSRELVVAAAKRTGHPPAALNPALQALLDKADPRHAVWFAALAPPELRQQLAKGQDTAAVADKVLAFSGDLDADQELRGTVRIHTADAKAAESVAEMLDAARGLVKLLLQSNVEAAAGLTAVVDGVKIGTRQSVVTLGVRVTADMLEGGGRKAPARRSGSR
jgi:hypothetical protein